MNKTVLHLDKIQKSFGGLRALADANLNIEEAKTHAIIGPMVLGNRLC